MIRLPHKDATSLVSKEFKVLFKGCFNWKANPCRMLVTPTALWYAMNDSAACINSHFYTLCVLIESFILPNCYKQKEKKNQNTQHI